MSARVGADVGRGHLGSCLARNRLRAVVATTCSLIMTFASWRGVGQPLPKHVQPLDQVIGLPVVTAFALYLFLKMDCVWERFWLGPAVGALLISSLEVFEPRLIFHLIGVLRVVSVGLWFWTLMLGIGFVVSAFKDGRNKVANPGA